MWNCYCNMFVKFRVYEVNRTSPPLGMHINFKIFLKLNVRIVSVKCFLEVSALEISIGDLVH